MSRFVVGRGWLQRLASSHKSERRNVAEFDEWPFQMRQYEASCSRVPLRR